MRVRFSNWICGLAMAVVLCAPAGLAAQGGRRAGGRPGLGPRPGRLGPGPRPGNILDRWDRMSPEQRRRALDNLPPERRKAIEERLQRYEQLSPEERQQLRQQYQRFRQFPPEQQEAARRLFNRFNQLPQDRRPVVRQEMQQLRRMDERDRRERMNSDEFRGKYTPPEQQLLQDWVKLSPRNDGAER